MAAVQQAQLHRLERRDVGDELRAIVLPRRPRAGEAVLDHPLPERLERPPARRPRIRCGAPLRRRRPASSRARCDPPSSRETRRCAQSSPPARDRRRGANARTIPATTRPLCGRLSQQTTVNAPPPARRRASSAATRNPGALMAAPGCARSRTMSGWLQVERSGRRIVAVTLLRDRQRDDVNSGIGNAREHAIALGPEEERFAQCADHTRPRAARVFLERRVEPVLRRQRARRVRRLEADAADTPARIALQHAVGVDRLVRAVEGAESEMHDADAKRRDVIAGAEPRPPEARRARRARAIPSVRRRADAL